MSNRKILYDIAVEKKFNDTKKKLETMISDDDFNRYFSDAPSKLIKYSELANINNIDELLPEEQDYRIILTESQRNSGHWCVILKYNDPKTGKKYIEWFDSYSGKPDSELSFIPSSINKMLGQDKHYLSKILKTVKEPYNILYNATRYQKLKDGINTCGSWCILRLMLHHIGYSLADFKKFIKESSKMQGNKPYDILVCDWVN
jgi:hypothetical protein